MLRLAVSCTLFAVWWIGLALLLKSITLDVGELPVDYRSYSDAADRLALSGSPYPDAETVQERWRAMHRSAVAVFRPDLASGATPEVVAGPYLYPPGLAYFLHQSGLDAHTYLVALTCMTVALCFGWLRLAGPSSGLWFRRWRSRST